MSGIIAMRRDRTPHLAIARHAPTPLLPLDRVRKILTSIPLSFGASVCEPRPIGLECKHPTPLRVIGPESEGPG